jgi:hypothetical protein
MAGPKELPDLIREFVDMAKSYLRQETVDPAKRLGRVALFSIGGGLLLTLAALFLVVAGHRLLLDVLPAEPDHQMWSGLGYLLSGVGAFMLAGIVGWVASR